MNSFLLDIQDVVNEDLLSFSSESFSNLNSESFNVIQQNIQSIRSNFDNFLVHLDSFSVKPNIIFLTEVWIDSSEIDLYNIPEYTTIDCCNNQYRAGGILAYVKNNIEYHSNIMSCKTADVLLVECNINNIKIALIGIYRFGFCKINDFVLDLKLIIQKINLNNIILLGDMNINILKYVDEIGMGSVGIKGNDIIEYMLMLSSLGFVSLLNVPTRIKGNSKSCIDHIFLRCKESNNIGGTALALDLNISDHHLTQLFLDVKSQQEYDTETTLRSIDYAKLNNLLEKETWHSVMSKRDPSSSFDSFIEIFRNLIKQSTCLVSSKSKKKYLKPWINSNLRRKIKLKNATAKLLQKHPTSRSLKKRMSKFVDCRKECEAAKSLFYLNKFASRSGDQKSQWKLVDEILGRKKNNNTIKGIRVNGDIINDPQVISDCFSNFFSEIAPELRSQHAINDNLFSIWENYEKDSGSTSSSMFLPPVNEEELKSIIFGSKNKKSCGLDEVSIEAVKKVFSNIVKPLVYIINQCFITGEFPSSLKCAQVIPLFKKGDPHICNNYRPISILSIFSKIIEKCSNNRLVKYLDHIGFLSNCQYGFRKRRSTEDAINYLLDNVYMTLNNNKYSAALFLDISKAFDMVDTSILIQKMFRIGIRGVCSNFFSSFLANRRIRVKVADSLSKESIIQFGVPQGSVLGPTLFLIYINSLFAIRLSGEPVAFADDTAILYSSGCSENITESLTNDLVKLRIWFDSHGLLLSEKTKIMLFRPSGLNLSHSTFSYHEQGCNSNSSSCSDAGACLKLEVVNEFKYLGVLIDNKLNWKAHSESMLKYLFCVIRKMYMLRKYCPLAVLKNVYFALFQSKITYGLLSWGGTFFATLRPIILAQKYIIRVMNFKQRRDSAHPIFVQQGILPLRSLYVFKVLRLFYLKSGNKNIKTTKYKLRHRLCVKPFAKTEYFRRYHLNLAPLIFNRLPNSIKSVNNVNEFLSELRVWLSNESDIELIFKIIT